VELFREYLQRPFSSRQRLLPVIRWLRRPNRPIPAIRCPRQGRTARRACRTDMWLRPSVIFMHPACKASPKVSESYRTVGSSTQTVRLERARRCARMRTIRLQENWCARIPRAQAKLRRTRRILRLRLRSTAGLSRHPSRPMRGRRTAH